VEGIRARSYQFYCHRNYHFGRVFDAEPEWGPPYWTRAAARMGRSASSSSRIMESWFTLRSGAHDLARVLIYIAQWQPSFCITRTLHSRRVNVRETFAHSKAYKHPVCDSRGDSMKGEEDLMKKSLEGKGSGGGLEDLVLKEKDVSKEVLYDILKEYVRFTEKGDIILLDPSSKLSIKDKVLLVLLAAKALEILEIRNEEFLRPKEIAKILGEQDGTVRSLLSALEKEGLAHSPERGLWTVNWSKLEEIKKRFKT